MNDSGINEEVLEMVWTLKEDGPVTMKALLATEEPPVSESAVKRMIDAGYVAVVDDTLELTTKGTDIARNLVRSHRLAERLFVDILDISDKYIERNACVFEHILSSEVGEAVCTMLGHPKECPHGRPIPPGACCEKNVQEVPATVLPLSRLRAGELGRILYVATRHHDRIDRLAALGVVPGTTVRVHQTSPTCVIKADETDVALETDIARDIFVRRTSGQH